ncbi:MAG: hypothetical protein V9H69_01350 [Anaerolineae bacterium]
MRVEISEVADLPVSELVRVGPVCVYGGDFRNLAVGVCVEISEVADLPVNELVRVGLACVYGGDFRNLATGVRAWRFRKSPICRSANLSA